jgi:transposase-like protein
MKDYPSNPATFERRFSNEASCREYLTRVRWPNGFFCPHCGSQKSWRLENTRFECGACGRQTSLTAGTIFEGTRKPLRLWLRAMWCLATQKEGDTATRMRRVLHLHSYQTAWAWLHKLRCAMAGLEQDRLAGSIEVDIVELWGELSSLPNCGEPARGFGCHCRGGGWPEHRPDSDADHSE